MKKAQKAAAATVPSLMEDWRLVLMTFIGLRLMLLMVYQPMTIQGVERGVSAGGDFQTYYNLAALSDSVGLPLRDWWSEFPPLWSYLTVFLYQAVGRDGNYPAFALALASLFLVADTGNLVLIRVIAGRIYTPETGMMLGWVYAVMAAPLIFLFWTFDVLVILTVLLGIWWLLKSRHIASAVAISVGTLFKLTPILIVGAVWRYLPGRGGVRYTAVAVGGAVVVFGAFLAQNAAMSLPSLTAQWNKASYQTVWALLDGNMRTGNFGPIEERLDPVRANDLQGNAAVVPGWLRLGAALAAGLFVYARTRNFSERGLIAFVTITLLIFFIQAQGWSPQWLAQIIPLVLLAFPTRNGVLALLLLSFVTFAEYPFLFIRSDGAIAGTLVPAFVMFVVARTMVLLALCVALYRLLRQSSDSSSSVWQS
ncbi:MAG: hypothetical protein JNM70_08985 [Anaerolineae bacterium]|nr:hypothetical protein [Anaerolineae bacterium]